MDTYKFEQRNEDIVCAILSLLKELDGSSLEIVRRDVERKIGILIINFIKII